MGLGTRLIDSIFVLIAATHGTLAMHPGTPCTCSCVVKFPFASWSFLLSGYKMCPCRTHIHEQSMKPHLSKNICKPTCFAKSPTAHPGRVSANTMPHQLHWGDWEMGTAISCTECSQVAGLIRKVGRCSSNAPSLPFTVFPCILL